MDDQNAFWEGNALKGADVGSFCVLNQRYAQYKKQVWAWDRPHKDIDLDSFELISDPFVWAGPHPTWNTEWATDKHGYIRRAWRVDPAEYTQDRNRNRVGL
ncbi:MAG: DKNYY domain-containing protein [Pseudomonadota bacterium]